MSFVVTRRPYPRSILSLALDPQVEKPAPRKLKTKAASPVKPALAKGSKKCKPSRKEVKA